MAKSDATKSDAEPGSKSTGKSEVAGYLDMPAERRTAAQATAAMLIATAQRVADELPLQTDVDDFRRVLVAEVRS